MELYPAIDLREGKCVRLVQGDYARETVYRGDPVAVADEFEAAGVAAVVVTEIVRDGMLAGPDLPGLGRVLDATDLDVIASGGVASVGDLRELCRLERRGRTLAGAVVGKALYEGRLSVEEAVAACAPSG